MQLPVRAPFHLEATVRLLQRRPTNRIDVWEGERYLRVLPGDGRLYVCALRNEGSIDAPRLQLSVDPAKASRAVLAQLGRTLTWMLRLDSDPSFAVPGASAAPKLRTLARALRGTRPPRFPTLFEAVCRIIPYQQVSLDAGSVIVSRLMERFGRRLELPDAEPIFAPPEPADLAPARTARFAGIGLSGTKIKSITAIARLLERGELSAEDIERLPTAEAMGRLDDLPGVGPWTAALILLRGFGRMDVFPAADVGAQRGLGRILGDEVPLAPLLERAGDRRGYLYFYSLGAQLLERGLIHPASSPRRSRRP